MKIKIFAVYALIITFFCLIYVNRQVEIFKLSYELRDKEKRLGETIDRNRILVYNNNSLKAPQYLAGMLKINSMNLELPETACVAKVKIVRKDKTQLINSQDKSWETLLADVFTPKAQAAPDYKR